ncbi:FAD-dependent oxidoreductase [Streptosporangium sp. NPDC048865]|uniref:FAD-dependent oxidoreductase n=1 Tax=Streptosporangium sp. NPDC048865 TaxID=3155766 RepID=UPI003426B020
MGRLGRRVVLVERSERMYGGTCPNVGCVPTKALVHRAAKRRETDPAQEWYERSVEEVQALTAKFRGGNYESLNGMETVTVVTGQAVFLDPHTVGVEAGGERLTISAETILINTGAETIIPDTPGLRESKRTLTSTGLIETTVLPERLAIVGGGYIGIEFASIYRRFGSRVTVFETSSRILGHEDDDAAAVAEGILTDEGIEIIKGAHVTEVRDGENDVTLVYERDGRRHTLEADAVLAATGRAPATRGLGLEAAGVRTTERGAVEVDEYLRTSQPHIYALGDVRGGPQHTYLSLDDSRVVLDQLVGEGRRSVSDRVAVPRTLFMTPPLATVGLTEKDDRDALAHVQQEAHPGLEPAEVGRVVRLGVPVGGLLAVGRVDGQLAALLVVAQRVEAGDRGGLHLPGADGRGRRGRGALLAGRRGAGVADAAAEGPGAQPDGHHHQQHDDGHGDLVDHAALLAGHRAVLGLVVVLGRGRVALGRRRVDALGAGGRHRQRRHGHRCRHRQGTGPRHRGQGLGDLGGRGQRVEPAPGLRQQRPADDGVQVAGNARGDLARRAEVPVAHGRDGQAAAVTLVARPVAGQPGVQQPAEALGVLAGGVVARHVVQDGVDSQAEQLDRAARRPHQMIGGQAEVGEVRLVRVGQRLRGLGDHRGGPLGVERATGDHVAEGLAAHPLADDVGVAVVLGRVEDLGEAGVGQPAGNPGRRDDLVQPGEVGIEGVDGDGPGEHLVDRLPQRGPARLVDAVLEPETLGQLGAGLDGGGTHDDPVPENTTAPCPVSTSRHITRCWVDPPTPSCFH